jgi:hypothetical protein
VLRSSDLTGVGFRTFLGIAFAELSTKGWEIKLNLKGLGPYFITRNWKERGLCSLFLSSPPQQQNILFALLSLVTLVLPSIRIW